eukprot:155710-Pelagomonas_calceolata.AAC.1
MKRTCQLHLLPDLLLDTPLCWLEPRFVSYPYKGMSRSKPGARSSALHFISVQFSSSQCACKPVARRVRLRGAPTAPTACHGKHASALAHSMIPASW